MMTIRLESPALFFNFKRYLTAPSANVTVKDFYDAKMLSRCQEPLDAVQLFPIVLRQVYCDWGINAC
jgi:hypothetical protein